MNTRILTAAILTVAIIACCFTAFATDASACEACQEAYEQMIRERDNKLIGAHRGSVKMPDGSQCGVIIGLSRNDDGDMVAEVVELPGGGDPVAFTYDVTGFRIDATRISFILRGAPVQLFWNEVERDGKKVIVIWGATNSQPANPGHTPLNGIWRTELKLAADSDR